MERTSIAFGLVLVVGMGCGGDTKSGPSAKADAGGPDGGLVAVDAGSGGTTLALDPDADAADAALSVCGLAPWVLSNIDGSQLPASKIENVVRDDVDTFVQDKPPICVDDMGESANLCDEMPTGVKVFTYVAAPESGVNDVEQVWCKSDSFEDIARIEGVTGASLGTCEAVHDLIVAWATAQLETPTTRSIVYEADIKMRGTEWAGAYVTTSVAGDVLTAKSPELYVPTKATYMSEVGEVPSFLAADFFGNHYCKLMSPGAALSWLSGK